MRSTTCYSDARANQTLDQTAAIVQRHGESTSPPLISFAVMSNAKQHSIETTHRGATNA